jgi:hypothetical protein
MLLSSVRRPLPPMDMRLFPAQNIGSTNRLRFAFYSTSPGTRDARSPLHSVVVSQVVASDTSSPGCGLAVELHIAAMQCLQARPVVFSMLLNSAACCNPAQYVATQCSMLQQRATCCNTLAPQCASSRMHAGCDVQSVPYQQVHVDRTAQAVAGARVRSSSEFFSYLSLCLCCLWLTFGS